MPDQPVDQPERSVRVSSAVFLAVEHGIYIALGVILSVTALFALGSAALTMWTALNDWQGGRALLLVIDRLLFVMMLAEILHTVRVSIRSGTLTAEPFLIVGLIASIRRVLVITMQSSQSDAGKGLGDAAEELFRRPMIELGILGGLILVLVISIFLIRRSGMSSERV